MNFGQFVFYLTTMLSVLSKGLESASRINQTTRFISVKTGANVTVKCFTITQTFRNLFWYRQALGQKLQHISTFPNHQTEARIHDEFEKNSRFSVNGRNGSNHLNIKNLHAADSATYYCAAEFLNKIEFGEGTYISVKESTSETQSSVHQPEIETILVGGSATLSCTIHTGICDGGHSVYWFKDARQSHSGLIYTHIGKTDQCERNFKTHTQTCIYNLPMENLNMSDGGTFYCAVASCGHILFGKGTWIHNKVDSNVSFLERGALVVTTFLSIFQAFLLCMIINRHGLKNRKSCHMFYFASQTDAESDQNEENIDYAAVRPQQVNSSRRQKNNNNKPLYSGVKT